MIKRFTKIGLCALFFFSTSTFALNPVPGWYAGLILGVSYEPDTIATFQTTLLDLPATSASLSYGVLGGVGGQIGYRCNHFRGEFEAMYNNNPYDTLTVGTVKIESPSSSSGLRIQGATNSGLFLFNGYYDLYTPNQDNVSQVVPYVGLGVGFAYVQNKLKFFYQDSELYPLERESSYTRPAGQAIAGVSYFMDDFTSFSLDARYTQTASVNQSTQRFVTFNEELKLYSINLTFNGTIDVG